MRIWKLFQRHYEQSVLHRAAKAPQMKIRMLLLKHYKEPFCIKQQKTSFAYVVCEANEGMEIILKQLQKDVLHEAAKNFLHKAAKGQAKIVSLCLFHKVVL
jgi:hypothetical protein